MAKRRPKSRNLVERLDKNLKDLIDMIENRKPKVLFINGAVYLPGEGGYKRTLYLFNMMRNMGYRVTLLTSDFNHYAKKVRDIGKFRQENPDFKDVEFVHVPSYTKNISIKRWWSGKVWSKEVLKWMTNHWQNYDIVYTSMPDIDTISKVAKICKKNGNKLVVDIRDLWPEVFRILLKKEWLYRIVMFPMKRAADKCYASADELVAVSYEYLNRGLQANTKSKHPISVYIGAVFDKFYSGIEKYGPTIEKKDGDIWVTYAGTLGSTYDLYTLLDTAEMIKSEGYQNIRFVILGQGPEGDNLKRYASEKKLDNVDFIGFVDYEKMAAYLSKSNMTINSVKRRASQSIINKVADYFAAGIPCLNGSMCQEMRKLIDDYQVGVNFEPENAESLKEAILIIYGSKEKAAEYGKNAKKLAKEKFDRSLTYKEIIKLLDSMVVKEI